MTKHYDNSGIKTNVTERESLKNRTWLSYIN